MSDPETDSDLNISQYDPEDDLNVYGSPVYVEQQELDTACEAPERPEGEQEQLIAGPSANIAFERQVSTFTVNTYTFRFIIFFPTLELFH